MFNARAPGCSVARLLSSDCVSLLLYNRVFAGLPDTARVERCPGQALLCHLVSDMPVTRSEEMLHIEGTARSA